MAVAPFIFAQQKNNYYEKQITTSRLEELRLSLPIDDVALVEDLIATKTKTIAEAVSLAEGNALKYYLNELIWVACYYDYKQVLAYLLKNYKPAVNLLHETEGHPFFYTLKLGCYQLAGLFIEQDASYLYLKYEDSLAIFDVRHAPVWWEIAPGTDYIAQWLANLPKTHLSPELLLASGAYNRPYLAEFLIAQGVAVNATDLAGNNVFIKACPHFDAAWGNLAAQYPAIVAQANQAGQTAFAIALQEDYVESAYYLAKYFKVDEQKPYLEQLLIQALLQDNYRAARYWLQQGASLFASNNGYNALGILVNQDGEVHTEAQQLLVELWPTLRPDSSCIYQSRHQKLIFALIAKKNLLALKFLEQEPALIANRDKAGNTLLMAATAANSQEIVEFLLANGAAEYIAVANNGANSPLLQAIREANVAIVKLLLKYKPEQNLDKLELAFHSYSVYKNSAWNASEDAKYHGCYSEICLALLQANPSLTRQDARQLQFSPLVEAAKYNMGQVIEFILEHGNEEAPAYGLAIEKTIANNSEQAFDILLAQAGKFKQGLFARFSLLTTALKTVHDDSYYFNQLINLLLQDDADNRMVLALVNGQYADKVEHVLQQALKAMGQDNAVDLAVAQLTVIAKCYADKAKESGKNHNTALHIYSLFLMLDTHHLADSYHNDILRGESIFIKGTLGVYQRNGGDAEVLRQVYIGIELALKEGVAKSALYLAEEYSNWDNTISAAQRQELMTSAHKSIGNKDLFKCLYGKLYADRNIQVLLEFLENNNLILRDRAFLQNLLRLAHLLVKSKFVVEMYNRQIVFISTQSHRLSGISLQKMLTNFTATNKDELEQLFISYGVEQQKLLKEQQAEITAIRDKLDELELRRFFTVDSNSYHYEAFRSALNTNHKKLDESYQVLRKRYRVNKRLFNYYASLPLVCDATERGSRLKNKIDGWRKRYKDSIIKIYDSYQKGLNIIKGAEDKIAALGKITLPAIKDSIESCIKKEDFINAREILAKYDLQRELEEAISTSKAKITALQDSLEKHTQAIASIEREIGKEKYLQERLEDFDKKEQEVLREDEQKRAAINAAKARKLQEKQALIRAHKAKIASARDGKLKLQAELLQVACTQETAVIADINSLKELNYLWLRLQVEKELLGANPAYRTLFKYAITKKIAEVFADFASPKPDLGASKLLPPDIAIKLRNILWHSLDELFAADDFVGVSHEFITSLQRYLQVNNIEPKLGALLSHKLEVTPRYLSKKVKNKLFSELLNRSITRDIVRAQILLPNLALDYKAILTLDDDVITSNAKGYLAGRIEALCRDHHLSYSDYVLGIRVKDFIPNALKARHEVSTIVLGVPSYIDWQVKAINVNEEWLNEIYNIVPNIAARITKPDFISSIRQQIGTLEDALAMVLTVPCVSYTLEAPRLFLPSATTYPEETSPSSRPKV